MTYLYSRRGAELGVVAMQRQYESLGTLGDQDRAVTCSLDAATRWARSRIIVPYPSFESAAQDVKQGRLSAVLVPAAYPNLHRFIMDANLEADEVFLSRISSLLLVGREASKPKNIEIIFHHPATESLLGEVEIPFVTSQHAASNSQACVDLLAEPAPAAAITNQLCCDAFQLFAYKVLRPGILMPFISFVRRESA